MKILTNRHFCWYLGPSIYRVLAAQRQGIVGVTPLIVAHWVVYSFYCQERHTYCMLCHNLQNCSWSSSCVTRRLYSWISATPRSAVSFVTWILQCHLWHLWLGSLSSAATIRLFMLSGTSWSKKPKPLIPQRGTRADQIICSVRLSHIGSYLPPWTRGSKGYFLSCGHFQYPLKPLFAICIKIFSLS